MKGWLSPLAARTWDDLRALQVEEWLWIDTTQPGVHRQKTLPAAAPQVTHVWGWTGAWAVRARVDVDLPGSVVGVVGASLTWGVTPPAGADEVDVTETTRPVWALGHGRSSIREIPGLVEKTGSVDLITLDVQRVVDDGTTVTFVPLTFIRA